MPASRRTFAVRFPARNESHTINVGHLDPIDEPSGIRQRLGMLGLYGWGAAGDADGDDALSVGLLLFQRKYGLEASGELDDATREKLAEVFGR